MGFLSGLLAEGDLDLERVMGNLQQGRRRLEQMGMGWTAGQQIGQGWMAPQQAGMPGSANPGAPVAAMAGLGRSLFGLAAGRGAGAAPPTVPEGPQQGPQQAPQIPQQAPQQAPQSGGRGLFSRVGNGAQQDGGLPLEELFRRQMNPYGNAGPMFSQQPSQSQFPGAMQAGPGMAQPFAVDGRPMPSSQQASGGEQLDKPPAPQERRRGLFGRIGEGISRSARSGELPMILGAMSAGMAGDHATAARIRMALGERRDARRSAEAAAQQRQSYMNNLMKPVDQGGMGMSPGEAERVMADPESFAQQYNERFGSDTVAGGSSRVTGGAGGQRDVWTAPQTFEQGADIVRFDANTGTQQRFAGMTAAEQEARALGLQPGTEQFNTYIRDRMLDAQGPTGDRQHRERVAATIRGQDVTARGQDIGARTAEAGRGVTQRGQDVAQRGQNLRGLTPTGRTATGQGGRRVMEVRGARGQVAWVDMQTGQPVQ